jgi:hypothetical protein
MPDGQSDKLVSGSLAAAVKFSQYCKVSQIERFYIQFFQKSIRKN